MRYPLSVQKTASVSRMCMELYIHTDMLTCMYLYSTLQPEYSVPVSYLADPPSYKMNDTLYHASTFSLLSVTRFTLYRIVVGSSLAEIFYLFLSHLTCTYYCALCLASPTV